MNTILQFLQCRDMCAGNTIPGENDTRGSTYHCDTGDMGMRVSPGKMFPAHASLGIRVSPHTYH